MIFYLIALIFVGIHLFIIKKDLSKVKVVETILLYLLVIIIGGGALFAFTGHTFVPDKVAKMIGWPEGNPFQYEVAMANLAIGILGILCIWFRDKFWLATIIAASIFLIGDGFVHIHQIVANNNYSPGNAGLPLYCDFINPILAILLYIVYQILSKKGQTT